MLRLITALSLCASASAAHATSVEAFKPTSSTRSSIIEIGCPPCVLAAQKAAAEAEVKLAPGEQIFEVRDVGGEKMIYRTEGWLGGSPVTMVSKATEANLATLGLGEPETDVADAPAVETDATAADELQTADVAKKPVVTEPALVAPELIEQPLFEPVIANSAPGIDTDATTSAVEKAAKPFDPSTFELRLN
ncbi:plant virulence effector HPE1-like domain-containing protein [Hoeflea sp.]|uniref:plant virulence effector HPE1-like domain-containing protein n=1 Tax=Hoeflea sp. TaxID=1940281 RepID=UPI003748B972